MSSITATSALAAAPSPLTRANPQTEDAFRDFAGETFFAEMLKALRSTQGETAYLSGGQGEKIFREQLDRHLSGALAESHGDAISKPLYGAFRRGIDVRA